MTNINISAIFLIKTSQVLRALFNEIMQVIFISSNTSKTKIQYKFNQSGMAVNIDIILKSGMFSSYKILMMSIIACVFQGCLL